MNEPETGQFITGPDGATAEVPAPLRAAAAAGAISGISLPGTPPKGIDVRRIVLGIVDQNPEARKAYLHEPAMHHGVEVTIGVLSRAADVLTTRAGHTHPEAEAIIRDIAVACSHSGGQENQAAIAIANGQLHPNGGCITMPVNRRVVLAAAVLTAHLRKDIQGCICGWSELGKSHIDHLLAELLDAGALDPPSPAPRERHPVMRLTEEEIRAFVDEATSTLGDRVTVTERITERWLKDQDAITARVAHDVTDIRLLFEIQQTRMREATARWRAEDPEARAQVLPDLGALLRWLMDQADKAHGHDRAVKLIRELYTLHPTGGPLHVALDDFNLDDHWLPFTPAYTIPGYGLRPPSPDTYDPRTHQLCDEIAGLLNGMTEEQREHAARTAHAAGPNRADQ